MSFRIPLISQKKRDKNTHKRKSIKKIYEKRKEKNQEVKIKIIKINKNVNCIRIVSEKTQ